MLVRSGAALVACRVADAAGLVAALASADEALVDGALRAVEFAAEERRVAAAPPLVDALRRLFAHGDGGCRRRALRCAARCGWLDGGSAALRELSGLAADPHAGVRAEVLACVAELRRRGGLEAAELGGVAQFALGALRDDDEKVATAACEVLRDVARAALEGDGLARQLLAASLPQLVPALLRAMRRTVQDVTDFKRDAALLRVDAVDRAPAPFHGNGPGSDDDDATDDEALLGGGDPSGAWSLRRCAASTLDAAAKATGGVLPHLLPLATRAFAGSLDDDDARGGPRGGGAPATAPRGVWEREAAILAVGAAAAPGDPALRGATGLVEALVKASRDPRCAQVREIAAWALGRLAPAVLDDRSDDAARVVDALLGVVERDDHKRCLEAACFALASVLDAVGDGAALRRLPPGRLVAALAAALAAFRDRRLLALYDCLGTLFWHAGDGADFAPLFPPLADRFGACRRKGDAPHLALPLLYCTKGLAHALASDPKKAAAGHEATFLFGVAAACVDFAAAGVRSGREHFSLRHDDGDADGGVGVAALECLGACAGALGESFAPVLDGACPVLAAALTAPHTHPTPHLYAAAATAATFIGDCALACLPEAARPLATLAPSVAALVAPCSQLDAVAPPAVVGAARTAAQNALWAVGELALALPDAALLEALGGSGAALLAAATDSDGPAALRDHAAYTLGRCCSTPTLRRGFGVLDARALAAWLSSLADCVRPDANELARTFHGICALAAEHPRLFLDADAGVVPQFLAAMASWRRTHAPAPPAPLALAFKRILAGLGVDLRDPARLAGLRSAEDATYLRALYG